MSNNSEHVCVVGGTGHLGMCVVRELRSRSIPVVAVARNGDSPKVQQLRELGAAVEFVDASRPEESYEAALESATAAVSCLAAPNRNVDETSDFWAIDRDANIRFGLQALESGARHLVLVSTFEGRESRYVTEFSDAKEEAVDVLRAESEKHGAALTVIRPNAYFRDLTDRAFENVLEKGEHKVLGDGSRRINPIDARDVATFIADSIQKKREAGDFLMGGPDVFTFREIGYLAAEVIGREDDIKIREVPLWLLRLMISFLGLIGRWSHTSRRQTAFLNWMVYVSTHDGVAPRCGKHRLVDEYKQKIKNHNQNLKV